MYVLIVDIYTQHQNRMKSLITMREGSWEYID